MTIVHDPQLAAHYWKVASKYRWSNSFKGPELFFPSNFRLLDRCKPTKEADIYAMAMSIYQVLVVQLSAHNCILPTQVLTGTPPSGKHDGRKVVFKVLAGTRPTKPENASQLGLSDGVCKLLEDCWQTGREPRPSVKNILGHAKSAASSGKLFFSSSDAEPINFCRSTFPWNEPR